MQKRKEEKRREKKLDQPYILRATDVNFFQNSYKAMFTNYDVVFLLNIIKSFNVGDRLKKRISEHPAE